MTTANKASTNSNTNIASESLVGSLPKFANGSSVQKINLSIIPNSSAFATPISKSSSPTFSMDDSSATTTPARMNFFNNNSLSLSIPPNISSSAINSVYNKNTLSSSYDFTPSIVQSVSGTENDSVFALCLPEKMPPIVKRLEHIQSQTPRTPKSYVQPLNGNLNVNDTTNIKEAGFDNIPDDDTRQRAQTHSITRPNLNTTDEMVNAHFKPIDIVSPTLKAMNGQMNAVTSEALNVMEVVGTPSALDIAGTLKNTDDGTADGTAGDSTSVHHVRNTTPIHTLSKSDGNASDFESMSDDTTNNANLNNIELICIQIAKEEKEAIDALDADEMCSVTDNGSTPSDQSPLKSENGRFAKPAIIEQSEEDFLLEQGYEKLHTLTKTLQGCVFKARNLNLMLNLNSAMPENHKCSRKWKQKKRKHAKYSTVVIKRTNKNLHSHGITIQDGKQYSVKEDIIKEMKLMKHCLQFSPPAAMIQFLGFFESSTNYYLVMEDGGIDCFDFVVEAHEYIAEGRLKLKEWRKFCKFLFWQMTLFIKWMHYEVRCCHLDISLENLLLQNAKFVPKSKNSKLLTLSPHVQIKFCDFGLAEFFDVNDVGDFRCTKYCGKANYKAPQVYHKKGIFDARKADIWSLGIVFFSMVIGAPPYIKPIVGRIDDTYDYVERGCIAKLLYDWERNDYVTLRMLNLMNGMLSVNEDDRLSILQIVQHPWLNLYKEQYTNHVKQQQKQKKQKKRKKMSNSSFRNRSKTSAGMDGNGKKTFSIMYKLDFPTI